MSNIVLTPHAAEATARSPMGRWIASHSLSAFFLLTFGYSWLLGLPLLLSSWQVLAQLHAELFSWADEQVVPGGEARS